MQPASGLKTGPGSGPEVAHAERARRRSGRAGVAAALALLAGVAAACDDAGEPGAAQRPADRGAGADARGGEDAGPADAQVSPGAEPTPDAGPPPLEAGAPGTVTQRAGDASRGFADGVGAQARFGGLTCLALAPDGATLYASDTFNGTVRAVDLATRAVRTVAGRPFEFATLDGPGGQARFTSPRGCVAAAEGLYLADGPTLRRVAAADGAVETLAGQAETRGDRDGVGAEARLGSLLHQLARTADGRQLLFTDRSNDALRALDLTTGAVSTLLRRGDGLDGPGGLALDGDTLYLANTFAGEILRAELRSGRLRVLASGLDAPQGVALAGGAAWAGGFDGALHRIDLDTGAATVAVGVPGDPRVVDGAPPLARLGGTFASVAVDAARGALYYVDLVSEGVRRIDLASGAVGPLVGPEGAAGHRDGPDPRFEALYDVVADGDGWLVADPLNHAVRRVDDATGAAETLVGRPGDSTPVDGALSMARLSAPVGLAVAAGGLFVADYGADAIRWVDRTAGAVRTLVGPEDGVEGPWGLGLGPDGSLYFTEADRGGVWRLDAAGQLEPVVARGLLDTPLDVAVDPADGRVYVADAGRAAVYRVDPGGTLTVVVGQPGQTGVRDGALADALLGAPSGLTFVGPGLLLVVDEANHHVRAVDLVAGQVARRVGHPLRHGGQHPGAVQAWAEATFEAPRAVAVRPDGVVGVVGDYALWTATPPVSR